MKKNLFLALCLSAFALVGCSSDYNLQETTDKKFQEESDDTGVTALKLNSFALSTANTIVSQALHVPITSHGETNLDLSQHILTIKITNVTSGAVIVNEQNHRNITVSTIAVPAGTYLIEAETANSNSQIPTDRLVGFSQPTFALSEEVVVTDGQTLSYDLVAKQMTAGIKVNFSGLFESYYPCLNTGENYKVVITASNGAEVTFESGEERTAFFYVGDETVTVQSKIILTYQNTFGSLETEEVTTPFAAAMPTGALQKAYLYDAIYTVLGQ